MSKLAVWAIESLESRELFSAVAPGFGLYHPSTASLTLDFRRVGTTNVSHTLGSAGSQAVAADFNGDTITDTAAFLNGLWSIDYSNDGSIDKTVNFGAAGDLAVAGDITGAGKAALGVYSPSTGLWNFSANQSGNVSYSYQDQAGGVPLTADFNHSGHADLILYQSGHWTVTDPATSATFKTFNLGGSAGDVPIISDYFGNERPAPGIFNNGNWLFDTTRTGQFNFASGYVRGAAGDQPLVGYFDPSNSIYVAPGGHGDGSISSPLGTIASALTKVKSGQNVRISAGNYAENLYLYGTDNVDIIGAGMNAVSIDPNSGDALALDRNSNTWIYNLNFASGQNGAGAISSSKADRGLVMLGGGAYLRGVSTVGTVDRGVLGTGYLGVACALDARGCHFDGLFNGDAVRLQNQASLFVRTSTFDHNGTNTALASSDQTSGRGLIVELDCSADVKNCDLSNNHSIGAIAAGSTSLRMRYCTVTGNVTNDGVYVGGSAHIAFRHNNVASNGTVRSVEFGSYGLEIGNDFVSTAVVAHNTFNDEGAAGLFIGNGTVSVINNSFYDDMIAISVNGAIAPEVSTVPVHTTATITGNIIAVPAGTSGVAGIYALGSDAGGSIGGDGALANTFIDLPSQGSIARASFGFNPRRTVGSPTISILANDYVNSPDPIHDY